MSESVQVDEELNLRGEVCPYTFVKSKLALEDLELGKILRVIVDNPESAENVPRSLANEGNEVLGVSPLGEEAWSILVKKR
ncbi:MAG: sulfurtransferase TusA family protein [candidate division NC10 bacterium]